MKSISFPVALFLSMLVVSCNGQPARLNLQSNYTEHKADNNVLTIDSIVDLKGGCIDLPACYRLVFEGEGCIRNGKVYVDLATYSIEGGYGIFDNVDLLPKNRIDNNQKCPIREFCAHWFGVTSSDSYDNTIPLQKAIDAGHAFAVPVYLPRGYYRITQALRIHEGDVLRGEYSGRITPNHQTGASFIRYCGDGKEMIIVEGAHTTIENILLAGSKPYYSDGFLLKNNAGEYMYLNNVLIVNSRYGVTSVLDNNEGFSGCVWNNVSIWKCVRGISIEITKNQGQYVTYNSFNNMILSDVFEKGAYFHCGNVNSTIFRDCLFERIGYGNAFDSKFVKSEIASIYVKNEANQGSIIIDGGYCEDVYFGKDGEPASQLNDQLNAVYTVENISLTVRNTRFSNTRTIVRSKGIDNISLSNCIDNGYYVKSNNKIVAICMCNANTVLDINNYGMVNQDKVSYETNDNSSIKSSIIRNLRKKDFQIQ